MNNKQLKKEREKRYVEVVRDILKGFPNGQLIADEHQERPDVLVLGTRGKCDGQAQADLNAGRDPFHRSAPWSATDCAISIHSSSSFRFDATVRANHSAASSG